MKPYSVLTPVKPVRGSFDVGEQEPERRGRTSNEGYQRCPELPYCVLRTDFVNSELQYAVRKLKHGHGVIMGRPEWTLTYG